MIYHKFISYARVVWENVHQQVAYLDAWKRDCANGLLPKSAGKSRFSIPCCASTTV